MSEIPDRRTPGSVLREKVRFESGKTSCAGWLYPGSNGACVVMAPGLGVIKEAGCARFAERFQASGFTVLAFDYRRFGESGGEPRQVARVREQLEDWRSAVAYARALPQVDAGRVAAWGFSSSGGHVFRVAAADPALAAAIAQTPLADGRAATRLARRYTTTGALLRFGGCALRDALRAACRREPLLIPLAGEPGSLAVLTSPDARLGAHALGAAAFPGWRQEVAARSALALGTYSPGRVAARIACPLLVVVCTEDQAVPVEPALRAADEAPNGEVLRLPGGHYEPFLGSFERVLEAETRFLERHLLPGGAAVSKSAFQTSASDPGSVSSPARRSTWAERGKAPKSRSGVPGG